MSGGREGGLGAVKGGKEGGRGGGKGGERELEEREEWRVGVGGKRGRSSIKSVQE